MKLDRDNNKDSYFPYGTIHEDEFFETSQLKFVWDKAKNQHNYTIRLIKDAEYYRIISARAAEKDEIQAYREYRELAEKW